MGDHARVDRTGSWDPARRNAGLVDAVFNIKNVPPAVLGTLVRDFEMTQANGIEPDPWQRPDWWPSLSAQELEPSGAGRGPGEHRPRLRTSDAVLRCRDR